MPLTYSLILPSTALANGQELLLAPLFMLPLIVTIVSAWISEGVPALFGINLPLAMAWQFFYFFVIARMATVNERFLLIILVGIGLHLVALLILSIRRTRRSLLLGLPFLIILLIYLWYYFLR